MVGVDRGRVCEVLVDVVGWVVVDVAGAGPVDSEVKEGRTVGGPADFISGLAAVSNNCTVDTLLAAKPRVAGGPIIN